jgi:hypothetical protein
LFQVALSGGIAFLIVTDEKRQVANWFILSAVIKQQAYTRVRTERAVSMVKKQKPGFFRRNPVSIDFQVTRKQPGLRINRDTGLPAGNPASMH